MGQPTRFRTAFRHVSVDNDRAKTSSVCSQQNPLDQVPSLMFKRSPNFKDALTLETTEAFTTQASCLSKPSRLRKSQTQSNWPQNRTKDSNFRLLLGYNEPKVKNLLEAPIYSIQRILKRPGPHFPRVLAIEPAKGATAPRARKRRRP